MRPRLLVAPDLRRPLAVPPGTEAVVVGGGIAGVSAAVVLAERGVAVTLLEAAPTLGGRLGAWPHTLPDGTAQVVEHGFHAFFRHYYTWRAVLRRADPRLAFLRPVGGYPVISRSWPPEDLTGLPGAPPLNLLALFARSPSLGLRDLMGSDQALAAQLLAYDPATTTAAFDDVPAARFLADLGMSDRAQAMLFEAFARSFFARPHALSAAELIAMFHYYFLGNPEGIGFDAPDTDYLTCIWAPLRAYLERRGVRVRTATPVRALHAADRLAGRGRRGRRSTPGTSCWQSIPAPCAHSWRHHRSPRIWRGGPRPAWSRRRSRSPGFGSTATSPPPARRSAP